MNRLVYDSNYIDFIKQLSRFENCSSIIDLLDSLNYHRSSEVTLNKPDEKQQENKESEKSKENYKKAELIMMNEDDEREPLLHEDEPQRVTQDDIEKLANKHFPKVG